MHKKLGIIVLAVALIGGLFAALGPTPAWAADPPASFHPDGGLDGFDDDEGVEDGFEAEGQTLSDRNDGINTTAHLTLVGAGNTDTAHWYHCPVGTDEPAASGEPADFISQGELASCTQMGTDTTGDSPGAGGFTPADKAYGLDFNITTSLDNQVLDVLGLTCIGSAIDIEGSGQNCSQTLEEEIAFDDAETGEPDTTSAEIFQLCTRDLSPTSGNVGGDPETTGEPCDAGTTVTGSTARATVDARFIAFEHGDPVPNSGFVFRVRSSPDLDSSDLSAHMDETLDTTDCDGSATTGMESGADANEDPDCIDESHTCEVIESFSTFKTWQCDFTDSEVDDNGELALFVVNENDGEGNVGDDEDADCDDNVCILDSHYHASVERSAVRAVKSFDPDGGGEPDPPRIDPNAGCEAGETPDKEHSSGPNGLEDDPAEEGCFYDQFDDLFSGVYTIEITGVGDIFCPSGATTHDHNADGLTDHCHGTGGNVLKWRLNNQNHVVGDETVTFCFEGEPQTGATPPANHGCADETVKDTDVMHWGTQATEVFLSYAGTETVPDDPCRTGQTFKRNRVGNTETLNVCTFDNSGNKVSTQPDGATGGRLTWVIETTVGGELTGVRFVGEPPDETPDPDGETTTQIEAFRQSSNFVCVTLRDSNGNFVDEFCVEKRIERRGGGGGPACDITGTNGNDRIRGTRRGETICARRGNDRVRAKAGGDNVKGQKGRDRLRGGKGPDVLRGGKGFDRCLGGPGRDSFRGCEQRIQ